MEKSLRPNRRGDKPLRRQESSEQARARERAGYAPRWEAQPPERSSGRAGGRSSSSRHGRAGSSRAADRSREGWDRRGAERPPRPEGAPREEAGGGEIVYGRHPVLELLHSGKPVQRLHVLAGAQGIPSDIFTIARSRAIPVVHTDRARLDHLSHHANHQGIVAEAGGGSYADLQEVLARPAQAGEAPFFLVLAGVQDPGNFGAILRSAEAAGVHGVFIPGDGACGLTATVSKASAGADQHIPVVRVAKISVLLRQLRESGFLIAGTEVEGSVNYTVPDYKQPTAIVMGAEEAGLRPSVREACTVLVRLPMLGQVQSLNVSAAAAVFMYEVVRQRQA